jgi:hypothetical protein
MIFKEQLNNTILKTKGIVKMKDYRYKPCPFCACQPDIRIHSTSAQPSQRVGVECSVCDYTRFFPCIDSAIQEWGRRPMWKDDFADNVIMVRIEADVRILAWKHSSGRELRDFR